MGEDVSGLGSVESRNVKNKTVTRFIIGIKPGPGPTEPKLKQVEALLLKFKRDAADLNLLVTIDKPDPQVMKRLEE